MVAVVCSGRAGHDHGGCRAEVNWREDNAYGLIKLPSLRRVYMGENEDRDWRAYIFEQVTMGSAYFAVELR